MGKNGKLEPLPEDWERALAVVAHPDDLEYGAAGAVARWALQGKHIIYRLVATLRNVSSVTKFFEYIVINIDRNTSFTLDWSWGNLTKTHRAKK